MIHFSPSLRCPERDERPEHGTPPASRGLVYPDSSSHTPFFSYCGWKIRQDDRLERVKHSSRPISATLPANGPDGPDAKVPERLYVTGSAHSDGCGIFITGGGQRHGLGAHDSVVRPNAACRIDAGGVHRRTARPDRHAPAARAGQKSDKHQLTRMVDRRCGKRDELPVAIGPCRPSRAAHVDAPLVAVGPRERRLTGVVDDNAGANERSERSVGVRRRVTFPARWS